MIRTFRKASVSKGLTRVLAVRRPSCLFGVEYYQGNTVIFVESIGTPVTFFWSKAGALPFGNKLSLADHFKKHGADFPNATTDADYEALGDAFMAKPCGGTLVEGRRRNGDKLRFESTTRELGVVSRSGSLKTYYKVSPGLLKKKGGPTKYFLWECGR